jgi:dienelactone hydrolase
VIALAVGCGGSDRHQGNVRELRVARDGLYGDWFTPAHSKRRGPAVVVIGGSNGGLRATPRFARSFAAAGYPALALAYFKEPGLPKTLEDIPLEYFADAIRWVAKQPGVDRNKIVLEGMSRGGEGVLLIASTFPNLVHGVVALVPDYQTNYGWSLADKRVKSDELIRVERIRGPILTASGGKDQVWSSSVYTEQIEQRLDDKHFRFAHERLNFPAAGHALRGTASKIWPRTLALMRRVAAAPPSPARGS